VVDHWSFQNKAVKVAVNKRPGHTELSRIWGCGSSEVIYGCIVSVDQISIPSANVRLLHRLVSLEVTVGEEPHNLHLHQLKASLSHANDSAVLYISRLT